MKVELDITLRDFRPMGAHPEEGLIISPEEQAAFDAFNERHAGDKFWRVRMNTFIGDLSLKTPGTGMLVKTIESKNFDPTQPGMSKDAFNGVMHFMAGSLTQLHQYCITP